VSSEDSIAARATPTGQGAVALIRVSGANAIDVVAACAKSKKALREMKPRRQYRCEITSESGDCLDDVLLTLFLAPHSYTGENVVEISTHGGALVSSKVLERLLECGARLAAPGEFTQRAFLNGKMDLTQAEAVMDLITAKSEQAIAAAQQQLSGGLGERMEVLQSEMLTLLAHLEAYIDFPEEDIEPDTLKAMKERAASISQQLDSLLQTAEQGRILRDGVATVICGQPNVGKSSLLNLLAGYERVIVSEIAGTTRDTVEEYVALAGVPLKLIDTAGLRDSSDQIEKAGIERSIAAMAGADLILEVLDRSRPAGEQERVNLEKNEAASGKHIVLLNKSDLSADPSWDEVIEDDNTLVTSCAESEGIEELAALIQKYFTFEMESSGDSGVAINERHRSCLARSRSAMEEFAQGMQEGRLIELLSADLREAMNTVGEVVGKVDTEELLGEIFGSFCIGK